MWAISFALTAHGSVPAELAYSGSVYLGPWDKGPKPDLTIILRDNRRFDMLHCYTFSAVFGYLLASLADSHKTHYNNLCVTIILQWEIFSNLLSTQWPLSLHHLLYNKHPCTMCLLFCLVIPQAIIGIGRNNCFTNWGWNKSLQPRFKANHACIFRHESWVWLRLCFFNCAANDAESWASAFI